MHATKPSALRSGPVRFCDPISQNRDRDRSSVSLIFPLTEPDHMGPVTVGSVPVLGPVLTGPDHGSKVNILHNYLCRILD
jgi:hypothetical protein